MKLFKNVDVEDLQNILAEGILPISVTGNNNWEEDYRSNNSEDVVYLFKALNHGDTFTQYGLALIECDVDAIVNEMSDEDVNKDSYVEYICDSVKPEQILNVYIPAFVDCGIDDSRIKKVEYSATTYIFDFDDDEFKRVELTGELKEKFEVTAPISTNDFNYLRGVNINNTMIDVKDWRYEFT